VAVAITAAIVFYVAGQIPAAGQFHVSGTVTLLGRHGWEGDITECHGIGDYSDISNGTRIVVTDAAGKAVATGSLQTGSGVAQVCVFPFAIDVPAVSHSYGVEVSHRSQVQYSAEQLVVPVALTLGGLERVSPPLQVVVQLA